MQLNINLSNVLCIATPLAKMQQNTSLVNCHIKDPFHHRGLFKIQNKNGFPLFLYKGRHKKKIDFFLGKSPKLWLGGGQES